VTTSEIITSAPGSKDFVFVSYAREDREDLDRVLRPLDAAGLAYWFDERLEWDDNWWQEVRNRIHTAHAVIVLMSPRAATSDWVTREVLVAKEHEKTIFPVLLEGKVLPQLTERQYLDLSDGRWPPTSWLRGVGDRLSSGRHRRVLRTSLRGAALALPGAAALLLLALTVIPIVRDDETEVPLLTGDYNLGVAQFDRSLVSGVSAEMGNEIRAFVPGVVTGVERALAQTEDSGETDADPLHMEVGSLPVTVADVEAAEELAAQSNADAVLYGTFRTDGATLIAAPRLWLSPDSLLRAEELSGDHVLPVGREDLSRPDAKTSFRRLIADTASDLAELTRIVFLYNKGEYSEALDAVHQARDLGFVQPGLLDVFEGNLAGKLDRVEEARAAYERAAANPAYAGRARLGLAQVRFTDALDSERGCGPGIDVLAMTGVIDEYARLRTDSDIPGANIPVKAAFGEGRARLCLDASGHGEDDGRGRALLEQVIDAYDQPANGRADDDLRELAAEAHGLVGDHDARRARDPAELEAALGHLAEAVALSTFPDRRSDFALAQAHFLAEADQVDRACAMLREASSLAPSGYPEPTVPGLTCS
jgi:tetratricopeptide (TPR) repeat protein